MRSENRDVAALSHFHGFPVTPSPRDAHVSISLLDHQEVSLFHYNKVSLIGMNIAPVWGAFAEYNLDMICCPSEELCPNLLLGRMEQYARLCSEYKEREKESGGLEQKGNRFDSITFAPDLVWGKGACGFG